MSVQFCVQADFRGGSVPLWAPQTGSGFVTDEIRAVQPRLQYPEVNGGFTPQWWYGDAVLSELVPGPEGCAARPTDAVRTEDLDGRSVPLFYRQDVPANGSYRVTAALYAPDGAQALVFVGRRRLAWRGALPAGQTVTVTALCDAFPIIPRGQTEAVNDPNITVTVVPAPGSRVLLQSVRVEAAEAQRIFVMGDSTVADQTGNVPYAPGINYSGWGQMVGLYLPEECVSNHSHSGLTLESFWTEQHWAVMEPWLRSGDICLLQFGHNDQKRPHLAAKGGYTDWMNKYLDLLLARGVQPVLVTPLARNSWTPDGQYNDLLADWADAMLAVGTARGIPVLDLHGWAKELILKDGLEAAKPWFFPADFTHTNDFGAYRVAAFIAEGLHDALGLTCRAQSEWQPVEPLSPAAPPADCKLLPPDGDILLDYERQRPDDLMTRVEGLELIIKLLHFFPINVYNDLYEDVIGHEIFAGTVQCAAQNGLIAPALTADGKLHPDAPMTLQEFLTALIPGWAARKALRAASDSDVPDTVAPYARKAARQAVGEGLLPAGTPAKRWLAPLTRQQAAALCHLVKM